MEKMSVQTKVNEHREITELSDYTEKLINPNVITNMNESLAPGT